MKMQDTGYKIHEGVNTISGVCESADTKQNKGQPLRFVLCQVGGEQGEAVIDISITGTGNYRDKIEKYKSKSEDGGDSR